MNQQRARLIRDILIETILYGLFVVVYAAVVLRWLDGWLTHLFQNDLIVYAAVGLVLIVAQGVVLDLLTSFLLERLGLGRSQ
ncbi:MAG TPA: hypothetical protein EYH27_05455 [Anaerolineales bacterium]|nr:hypothetical protein [Anaerolineae bacterium]HIP87866.1 hypothetical protein [Anaerolineales bacterium]